MTQSEFYEKIKEVKETCIRYGFMDNTITPYGFAIKVSDFIKGLDGFEDYTDASKDILIDELTGFIKILDRWVAQEEEEKLSVKLIEGNNVGKVKAYPRSFADMLVASGFASYI